MKSSKSEIHSKVHVIPQIKFEAQNLTAYSGLVIFQLLFQKLSLKSRLSKCFNHKKVSLIFGFHTIFMFLVIHLVLGFRRIRDRDFYCEDPIVKRILGLNKIPDVSTITRTMSDVDLRSFLKIKKLIKTLVCERLVANNLKRVTLDFDGSVISTTRKAQGSAVGYNKNKKGSRSYYPLFCTVAQTAQFFDMRHRPGNVHDSNGSIKFMYKCFRDTRKALPMAILESRMDSAFFNEDCLKLFMQEKIEFTASVPFDRFSELKQQVETRSHWEQIDDKWSFFESNWKPKSWDQKFRFIFIRQKVLVQRKGEIQLDLFEPRELDYDYKVIVTNKIETARTILQFHNGRGSQENIFAQSKTQTQLDYTPTNNLNANRSFITAVMMTHNLSQEIQMISKEVARNTTAKRCTLWVFEKIGTFRNNLIHRAGRITYPQGKLTLTLNANDKVKAEFLDYFKSFGIAA